MLGQISGLSESKRRTAQGLYDLRLVLEGFRRAAALKTWSHLLSSLLTAATTSLSVSATATALQYGRDPGFQV